MVLVLPVRRALLGELDFVGPIEVVDLSHGLPVGRNDVHVVFDLRCIGHAKPPEKCSGNERCAGPKVAIPTGRETADVYRELHGCCESAGAS